MAPIVLRVLPAIIFGLLAFAPAPADELPPGPIRIVVPFGPGGTGDLSARIVGQQMGETLRRPVVVENIPGPFGIRALQTVAQSAADGRTIVLGGSISAVTPLLLKSMPYDQADFKWLSILALFNYVILVDSGSPLKTIADVIAAAKADPARFNIGTIGAGSIAHLASLLFKSMAKVDVPTVPYKSTGEVVSALKAGQVQLAFESLPGVLGQLQSGLVRAIAVTSPDPIALLPGVPTVSGSGLPQYVYVGWNGFGVLAKTPPAAVALLNRAMRDALNAPQVQAKLTALGLEPHPTSPERAQAIYEEEVSKWRGVVETANIPKQ